MSQLLQDVLQRSIELQGRKLGRTEKAMWHSPETKVLDAAYKALVDVESEINEALGQLSEEGQAVFTARRNGLTAKIDGFQVQEIDNEKTARTNATAAINVVKETADTLLEEINTAVEAEEELAARPRLFVAGKVTLPEGVTGPVTLTLTGTDPRAGAAKTLTSTGGAFKFEEVISNFAYTLTATCGTLVFETPSYAIPTLNANLGKRDFSLRTTSITVRISSLNPAAKPPLGEVLKNCKCEIAGAVKRDPTPIGEDGSYVFTGLPVGGAYTVKPACGTLVLDKGSQKIASLSAPQTCEFKYKTCTVSSKLADFDAVRDVGFKMCVKLGNSVLEEVAIPPGGAFSFANLVAGLGYMVTWASKEARCNSSQRSTPLADTVLPDFNVRTYQLTGTIDFVPIARDGKPLKPRPYEQACTVTVTSPTGFTKSLTTSNGAFDFGANRLRRYGEYTVSVTAPDTLLDAKTSAEGPWTLPCNDKAIQTVAYRRQAAFATPGEAQAEWDKRSTIFVAEVKAWKLISEGITIDPDAIQDLFDGKRDSITGEGPLKAVMRTTLEEVLAPVRAQLIAKVEAITTKASDAITKEKARIGKLSRETIKTYSIDEEVEELRQALRADPTRFPHITPGADAGASMTDLTTVATKLSGGGMKASDVMSLIPKGTSNTWTRSQRFANGFKYEWSDATNEYHVHGHTKDPNHSTGNSGTGSIVRVAIRNKATGVQSYLTESGGTTTSLTADSAHIPLHE